MKTIGKLKLNKLCDAELSEKEMNFIKGGTECSCGCYYANYGGSSSADNKSANNTTTSSCSCSMSCNCTAVGSDSYTNAMDNWAATGRSVSSS